MSRVLVVSNRLPVTDPGDGELLGAVIDRLRQAPELMLLCDYDGTLVPLAETPDLASPDEPLLELLGRVASRPGTELHVISGRKKESLEEWLGAVPIGLSAEHGLWTRAPGSTEWRMQRVPEGAWQEVARRILADWTERTPGSLTEEKTAGFAWHYRMADPELGLSQANELRVHLTSVLSNAPVEVLHGTKVIELRPQHVNKGRVVAELAAQRPGALVVAMGDDRTDEDMFAAVPESGLCIAVGPTPSKAHLRVEDSRDIRALLAALANAPG